MSECIRWESVIPNFQEGDVITPFGSVIQQMRDEDMGWNGGIGYCGSIEGLASVKRKNNQKVGVYDPNGVQILPEEFDECEVDICSGGDFFASGIRVKKQGLYGLYNRQGRMIVPPKYKLLYFSDYAVIVRDEKDLYGAYSLEGKQFVNCEYDNIQFLGSLDKGYGCAITVKNRLMGAILEDGVEIIPCRFKLVERDVMGSYGYIVSDTTNLKGWYSRNGKSNIPCKFKSLNFNSSYHNPNFQVETPDGLKGIYSLNGKEIVPPKFESINRIGNYLVGLIGKDKLSVYDWNGVCLYPTAE